MHKKTFAVLLLLLPMLGFSQINQSLDIRASLDYSYRHLSTQSEDPTIQNILPYRDSFEIGKLSWSTSLDYNVRLTKHLFLKTGIQLQNTGYQTRRITIDNGGDETIPTQIRFINNYYFVAIPIAARFEFNQKKIAPFCELGIAPSMYLTTKVNAITDVESGINFQNGVDSQNFNRVHLGGFLSFGLNYNLSDKFQLFGQPTFRYNFTKLVNAPIREQLFSGGLEMGVRLKLS